MSNSIIKTRAFSQLQEMKQWGFKLRRMLGCKFKRSKAQISEWLMSHASLFTFGPNHFAELKIFWTCFFYFLFALSCELCAFPWFYQWLLFTTVIRAFFFLNWLFFSNGKFLTVECESFCSGKFISSLLSSFCRLF